MSENEQPTEVDKITRRVEGIAVWAIPGVDSRAENIPDRIPDRALEAMNDRISSGVRERRNKGGK